METSAEDLDRIHAVNVKSLMLSCKAVLPGMVKRGSGAIISIASVAGLRYLGYPHLAYCTTKAAVIQMTRMIAQEYAPHGIRANTVVPGLIDTPRIAANVAHVFSESLEEAKAARARQVPLQRMGTPWEVANACAFLASDAASYVTGTELLIDGGLTGNMYNGESNHPRRHATETAGLGGWHSERLGRQAQGHALKDSFAAHNHHDALFHISLQAMAA